MTIVKLTLFFSCLASVWKSSEFGSFSEFVNSLSFSVNVMEINASGSPKHRKDIKV